MRFTENMEHFTISTYKQNKVAYKLKVNTGSIKRLLIDDRLNAHSDKSHYKNLFIRCTNKVFKVHGAQVEVRAFTINVCILYIVELFQIMCEGQIISVLIKTIICSK